MIGRGVFSAMRMALAMMASYRRSSRDFFRSRQRAVLFVGFALTPLASIPEALLSPLLMLGDPGVSLFGKAFGSVVLFFFWSAWIASQKQFIASIKDLRVLTVLMSPSMTTLCVMLRYFILSWPAFLLLATLHFLHDGSGRAEAAELAICAVVVSSSAMSEWRDRHADRPLLSKSACASATSPIFRHAFSGVASWADPRVPCLHACSLVALLTAQVLLSRLESPSGVITISVIGSISALIPLRALLDLASQRTKDDCPLLLNCPRYHVVETYQVCILMAVLCGANLAVCAARLPWAGSVASSVSWSALLAAILAFVICRIAKVTKVLEAGTLCVLAVIGAVMEYV